MRRILISMMVLAGFLFASTSGSVLPFNVDYTEIVGSGDTLRVIAQPNFPLPVIPQLEVGGVMYTPRVEMGWYFWEIPLGVTDLAYGIHTALMWCRQRGGGEYPNDSFPFTYVGDELVEIGQLGGFPIPGEIPVGGIWGARHYAALQRGILYLSHPRIGKREVYVPWPHVAGVQMAVGQSGGEDQYFFMLPNGEGYLYHTHDRSGGEWDFLHPLYGAAGPGQSLAIDYGRNELWAYNAVGVLHSYVIGGGWKPVASLPRTPSERSCLSVDEIGNPHFYPGFGRDIYVYNGVWHQKMLNGYPRGPELPRLGAVTKKLIGKGWLYGYDIPPENPDGPLPIPDPPDPIPLMMDIIDHRPLLCTHPYPWRRWLPDPPPISIFTGNGKMYVGCPTSIRPMDGGILSSSTGPVSTTTTVRKVVTRAGITFQITSGSTTRSTRHYNALGQRRMSP